jgi:hypothetical protein
MNNKPELSKSFYAQHPEIKTFYAIVDMSYSIIYRSNQTVYFDNINFFNQGQVRYNAKLCCNYLRFGELQQQSSGAYALFVVCCGWWY